ncbi:(S)-benzoin forming benzil reductase [Ornithinibacillus sp. L9]|uniref:(S)-benzoin forming benzil reductase n=1 Tax=Ornithinibacillus caprae TaxID=2678566 RepID=A0A6N8FN45_9BACI|nr:(S)-benzoin forming benzil reductase [Ornithinibacillus caprae]MUK88778.1 (S)-benzoin forming benzil reductase [Ornithinibacillus caprae]
MKTAVITGVSRGLGEAVAELFLESGVYVIGISRNANSHLDEVAKENNSTYKHLACNLGNQQALENTLESVKQYVINNEPSILYLVNNAAVIDPIDQSMNIDSKALVTHVQVNTVAPMVIMNSLLKLATEVKSTLIGVNVSSGAAERPIYGWSAYCSTKASINMYTQTVALEQAERKTGHKVIAFSPGVMDTNMQEKIRSSSREAFVEVDTFKNYKESNLLRDANSVGNVLFDIMRDEVNLKSGKIYNVKDYF